MFCFSGFSHAIYFGGVCSNFLKRVVVLQPILIGVWTGCEICITQKRKSIATWNDDQLALQAWTKTFRIRSHQFNLQLEQDATQPQSHCQSVRGQRRKPAGEGGEGGNFPVFAQVTYIFMRESKTASPRGKFFLTFHTDDCGVNFSRWHCPLHCDSHYCCITSRKKDRGK